MTSLTVIAVFVFGEENQPKDLIFGWILGTDCFEAEYQDEHTDFARWKLSKLRRSKTKVMRSRGSSDQVLGLGFFSITTLFEKD